MRKNRPLSFIVLVLFSIMSSIGIGAPNIYAATQLSDVKGHWAESQVQFMLEHGIVTGYSDNTFKPDSTITRAEFITMTNKTFKFAGSTTTNYIDVQSSDWFAGEIAKAMAAGYISGYEDGSFRPNKEISRQEAAVIIARILAIQSSNGAEVMSRFRDAEDIPSWSRNAVAAVVGSGYMKGYPDGTFKATDPIKRAEAVVLLKSVLGERPQRPKFEPKLLQDGTVEYNHAGIYGPEANIETTKGNAVISADGVILQNTVITGDLTIEESVGTGSVTLRNVIVSGTTTVKGGGPNSIILINFKGEQVVIDVPNNNQVRLVAQGDTDVGKVSMKTAGKLQESGVTGKGFQDVVLTLPKGSGVELVGNFSKVSLEAPETKLTLKDGTVENLIVSQDAISAEVNIADNANVNTLNVHAKSVIDGQGVIQTANVTAKDVTITQKPVSTDVSPGVTANVGGSSISGKPSFSGGGGGGGGGGSSPPPAKSMVWSSGQFKESAANDGSISNSITVTLTNETFSAGNLDLATDYTVSNVPGGLTVSVVKTSDTAATVNLVGNATQHTAANSVCNLTITFTNNAFTGGNAGSVANSSREDLAVIFNKALTIMVYADADNDLEPAILTDIEEMKLGVTDDVNLIALVDRSPNYSVDQVILGENFTDTRLYKITHNGYTRISGGYEFPEITTTSNYEANTGDAVTLKKFIRFSKANYPADKYALFLLNHGGGARGSGMVNRSNIRAVCFDGTSGSDTLYTGEISDVLTADESVDLLGFDACLMGSVEVAYQFRPGNGGFNAQVMVASAPLEWGYGWQYDKILERLDSALAGGNNGTSDLTIGGQELYYSPVTMTTLQLGGIIVEEQRDSVSGLVYDQSMSCYDLTEALNVKNAVDDLSVSLYVYGNGKSTFESIRNASVAYFDKQDEGEWITQPLFDLYDLAKRTRTGFDATIQAKADTVISAVYGLVAYSFAGSDFAGFEEGSSGVSIFFPDGDSVYNDPFDGPTEHWKYQWWYNSIDTNAVSPGHYYGKLKWCQDNQDPDVNEVGNWFEMLDAWFDPTNVDGGSNGYQW